jgi:hypothetical protein
MYGSDDKTLGRTSDILKNVIVYAHDVGKRAK